MTAKLLKTAADRIEALSAELETLKLANAKLEQEKTAAAKLVQEKTAADKQASEKAKADIADLAKTAAAKLFEIGLLTSAEKRDATAAKLASDPASALDLVLKCAELTRMPKQAKVIVETGRTAASADAVWDQRVAQGIK